MTLRRWIYLGILGFSSGLPFMVTGMTLAARLTDAGFSLQTLGLFALVGMPYALKVFWAPCIENVPLPFLGSRLGQRRSWAFLAQMGILLMYAAMAFVGPESNILMFASLCFGLTFFSATQDVALDGYRIAWLEKHHQAWGAGVFVNCYRLALMVSGAGIDGVSNFGCGGDSGPWSPRRFPRVLSRLMVFSGVFETSSRA
jgi:PAT family beta-lactamase induction signal transducer AmpG